MVENMKIPEGYRMTEVGVIPGEWEVGYIKDLSLISTGNKNTQDKVENGQFPFFVRSFVVEKINSYSYDGEAVLTAGDGVGTGKVFHYINGKFDYHQRVYKISDFSEKLNGYFFYLFFSKNFFSRIMAMTAKSSVDSVRMETISNMKIPLPSLQEQQAIATALTDIDNLITSIEKLIDKKEKIKQGTMQELLTGKKRLPGFSERWEEKRLGDIAEITMGQSPSSEYYNIKKKGLPLFQGNADIENRKTITRIYTSQVKKQCYKDDIIMTVRAPVGAVGKAITDGCIGRGVCAIKYNNDYLYQYLIFIEDKWGQISKGSTFDSINSREISELKIYMPSDIKEQQAIAQILSDMDLEIEALKRKLEKYKTIKQGMMQELLTGRIRLV